MISIPVEPKMTEYLHRKASKLGIPFAGTFELTPLCNLNCRMCYVHMSKTEQEEIAPLHSAREWISLGEKLMEKGLVYLLLTGGEPFLRKDFKEIMQGLHRLGLIISINSNGLLITDEVVEWLKETPPVRINITMYGASDETYERLCGDPHGYTKVTASIERLRKAGISVKINCSVTPYNVCDLKEIIQWTKDHGLIVQATSYMFPPVRKDPTRFGSNARFTPEEASYYSAKIEQYLNGDELFLKRYEDKLLMGLSTEVEEDCMDTDQEMTDGASCEVCEGDPMWCRAGRCSYWITWDGRCLPCGMFEEAAVGNVFETDFDRCWEIAKKHAAAIRLPVKCKTCEMKKFCKTCAAMVYSETGGFAEAPSYRCAMAKSYMDACRQVRDEILQGGAKVDE